MIVQSEISHSDYIDSLRGIAILGVLAYHAFSYGQNTFFPEIIGYFLTNGSRGVQLFYIISAFTLFNSLSIRFKKEKHAFINYFNRRFFRIAPLFYVSIIFYLIWYGLGPRYWLGDAKGITLLNIISTVTFTNGFYPYFINSIVPGEWSIAIEMIFYVLLPIIFLKVKSVKSALFLCIVAVIINYFNFRFVSPLSAYYFRKIMEWLFRILFSFSIFLFLLRNTALYDTQS